MSRITIRRWTGLSALILVLSVVSCGGESVEEAAAPQELAVKAENAEVGKGIEAQGWKITLLEPPEQMEKLEGVLGDARGAAAHLDGFNIDGRTLSEEHVTAKGVYVMVPVEVRNVAGEPQMMSGSVMQVIDSEAQEYDALGRVEHIVYVWTNEGWMDDAYVLVPFVFDVGDTREGPVIFDVPADATGLKLVMEGTDETIDLGF